MNISRTLAAEEYFSNFETLKKVLYKENILVDLYFLDVLWIRFSLGDPC